MLVAEVAKTSDRTSTDSDRWRAVWVAGRAVGSLRDFRYHKQISLAEHAEIAERKAKIPRWPTVCIDRWNSTNSVQSPSVDQRSLSA